MADDNDLNLPDLDEVAASGGSMGMDEEMTDPPEPDMSAASRTARDLEAVYDIPVGRGAVVELDRKVGEAIDIYVNNRLVARGEVVVVEDRLGVTMTEIIKTDRA